MNIGKEFLSALSRIPGLFAHPGEFWKGLREIWRALCVVIHRLLRREHRLPRRRGDCCIHLPPDVYKRPDPLIYAQYYLMKMGLAVTWDNPDIQLFEFDPAGPNQTGAAVPSSDLKPDHRYRVGVRVWNGSYDAPAANLPVHLFYLTFGVGGKANYLATAKVDLHVKGSPLHPSFAFFDWKTPAAGHYCLLVALEWNDDANPENNVGQENVTVGALHSPAKFSFVLRNDASVRRQFVLEADAYRLPDPRPCDPDRDGPGPNREPPVTRRAESAARWERALREQNYGAFPVPTDWAVDIQPREVALAPNDERTIEISIEGKHPGAPVAKAFNVHAFALDGGVRRLAGGVTLNVTSG